MYVDSKFGKHGFTVYAYS